MQVKVSHKKPIQQEQRMRSANLTPLTWPPPGYEAGNLVLDGQPSEELPQGKVLLACLIRWVLVGDVTARPDLRDLRGARAGMAREAEGGRCSP